MFSGLTAGYLCPSNHSLQAGQAEIEYSNSRKIERLQVSEICNLSVEFSLCQTKISHLM